MIPLSLYGNEVIIILKEERKSMSMLGKTIIVFGASSGIGKQSAIDLACMGANVILVARREELLQEIVKELPQGRGVYIVADLQDDDTIEGVFDIAVTKFGKMDGMVYSAGIAPTLPYKVTTPKQMQRVMQINFFSFYEAVRQFAKKKYSNDGSKIVGLSSCASVRPAKGQSAYAASKGAMDAAKLALAKELMPRKISINTIRPAFVRTPMSERYEGNDTEYSINQQPLGFADPKDITAMITYLLSEKSNMITGRSYEIDGGSLL